MTASKIFRASSCETRSRMAPHSTRTRAVDGLDGDVPAVARDAVGPVFERRRLAGAAADCQRGDTNAAIGEPLISTRTAMISFLSIGVAP